jgi:UDP-glucose 4-epimerase
MAKIGLWLPFVYAGSSTAYGDHNSPQTENMLPRVQSPYSATKLSGEILIQSFVVTFGAKATVLRYFQVYGPNQPSTGPYALVTGIFLKQAREGSPLTIEGSGQQTRDFVHVRDVARANVMALSINSEGKPINIGTGKSHSIKQLADLISDKQIMVPARKIDLPGTCAVTEKAEKELGWVAKITLEEGIRELL